jgi:8-oxo-dGTP pyrophosphatase MutT (NUDIX family)
MAALHSVNWDQATRGEPVDHRLIRQLCVHLRVHRPFRLPRFRGWVFAAVAAVVYPVEDDLGLVFIARSSRRSDRWSGDIAFPGGLSSRTDRDSIETARREAMEEVGIELGEPLGCLSDRFTLAPGSFVPMRVRPVIFALPEKPVLRPNPAEVARTYLTTLREVSMAQRTQVQRKLGPLSVRLQGRKLGDHVLWGLTLSMVREIERRSGR